MENWKFLIDKLLIALGLVGSFMGTTFSYSDFLIKNIGQESFIFIIGIEMFGLIITYFFFLVTIIDFIKDNKKGRK